MSSHDKDVYGGNYPKAKRLAIARSGGKCQFCGLRKARDAHHWAYPGRYPSGRNVQGHDLTALCKPCHELASIVRDWVVDKGADMNDLAEDFKYCNTYIAKREAFSYWLYPEDDEQPIAKNDVPTPIPEPEVQGNIKDQMYGWQVQIGYYQDVRSAIKRQMGRLERGESLDTPAAWQDLAAMESETFASMSSTWSELNAEYKAVGRKMGDAIRTRESLRKQQDKVARWRFFFILCGVGIVLYLIFSVS